MKDNIVLLGDAAHTAHFSIGSGTKLAIEDALALAACLNEHDTVTAALAAYDEERRPVVESTQRTAQASLEWFASSQGLGETRPAMFQPYRLGEVELKNRIVVSPMNMYSAGADGVPRDFHLVHLGSKAMGGAGLVMAEMTAVTQAGRITPSCVGLYSDEQVASWRRITDYAHAYNAKSASNSAMPAGRDRPSARGRASTNRCRRVTGHSSPPPLSRIRTTAQCCRSWIGQG